MNKIQIIQGGQYGSEAKGAIAAHLVKSESIDIAVRTGATNAGHTVYHEAREWAMNTTGMTREQIDAMPKPMIQVKMQQLPVGWVRPDTVLVLGAGAIIDPLILDREVEEVSRLTGENVRERLLIDPYAGVHLPDHAKRSESSGRHHAIGATGKGCSEALIDKIKGRGAGYEVFGKTLFSRKYRIADTAAYLNKAFDDGRKIQLEGTQGTLLDLNFGPYPYTTHKPTGPAQWMVECGLSPALPTDIVMVMRTYPIRVAGNSGPMFGEMGWPTFTRTINAVRESAELPPIVRDVAIDEFEAAVRAAGKGFKLPAGSDGLDQHTWTAAMRVNYAATLSELNKTALSTLEPDTLAELSKLFEFTTVTKKLRRIGRISIPDLKRAGYLCRPHRIALTFMNYEFPSYWYETPAMVTIPMARYIAEVQKGCGAPVTMMSFGPYSDDTHIRQL